MAATAANQWTDGFDQGFNDVSPFDNFTRSDFPQTGGGTGAVQDIFNPADGTGMMQMGGGAPMGGAPLGGTPMGPQAMDTQAVSQYSGMLAGMDQEAPFYDRCFQMIDTANTGFADAEEVISLFRRSGLNDMTLDAIWQFTNPVQSPVLDKDSFFVGCRLIAHAQNGMVPSVELISSTPPSLPYFALPEHEGGEMDFPHVMDPTAEVVVGDEFGPPAPQYLDPGLKTGFEAGTSPYPDADYEARFAILDPHQTGFIDGTVARSFLQQSGLDEQVLYSIWEQSDLDGDGRLSLQEFLTACHLVGVIIR
eukprot:Blabericola_migrator_1__3899@NODE_217_length_11276_cov_60_022660_g184_i0_p4_GENE_NODE_217_length_11276_cov_60_022660_g184_i0NODE_217_length_11276_cov_60_022660_g184_i0_p4_ORF_typecomplete_len307_score62_42EFhand_4/PF12763_7/5_3e12EFhand_4/PF12763_7/9_4e18EFhand_7/PF13499_6/0_092EFhand_7/PF13499_6/6_2e07EFhand_6/PF13405_6/0_86EFhand_6/PF13405_6/57EFhand_6/PF13405_6/0_21EFhand_9/PF14658_6/0_17EFhand_9/PF14658_6/0_58EFhand_8/PF13833_6/6_6e02EFhand_8/PF13833_6/0_0032EFhand_11/PF08976_11/1_3e02EFhand